MATKIILTIDDGLSQQEIDDLRYLFSDAFGEFATRRWPPDDYVEQRYPGKDVYPPGPRRIEKIVQVQRRVALAQRVNTAAHTFETVHVGPGLARETLNLMAESEHRAEASVLLLQDLFGMEEEEAQATFNQLEDKRVAKMMREQGLVKS
jgi:hypothetical protein